MEDIQLNATPLTSGFSVLPTTWQHGHSSRLRAWELGHTANRRWTLLSHNSLGDMLQKHFLKHQIVSGGHSLSWGQKGLYHWKNN